MSETTAAEIRRYRETTIASFGREVNISRASVHRFANIFIEESRVFIPEASLPAYRGVPLWFAILILAFSFGGAGSLTGAIVFLVADCPMLVIYFQNEWVNRKTLPIVKKQPLKNDLQTLNDLCEVTHSELEMIALSTYDRAIGFVRVSQGKVRFQVFHPAAFALMDKAKSTSRWLPIVKKQPLKNDLQTLNDLCEVTHSELEMIALSTYDRAIGFVRVSQGKVRFQVFHPAAFALMDKAKSTSRWLLGMFLFVAMYNIFFIVLYSVIIK